MPDRDAYDRSRLDRERLDRYAARVARETRSTPEPAITYEALDTRLVRRLQTKRTWYGGTKNVEIESHETSTRLVEVVGPHWRLSYRRWHRDETRRSRDGSTILEQSHYNHYYLLLPDGTLKDVWTCEETVSWFGGQARRVGTLSDERSHHVGPLSDARVLDLDFEQRMRYWEKRKGDTHTKGWGDRDPGRRLLKHSKGVGMNLALKAILEMK